MRTARTWFESQARPVSYDLTRPEAAQRNRTIEATAWVDRAAPDTWAQAPMCQQVMRPFGMDHHRHLRVLICEGPVLLGWFGGVQDRAVEPRQRRVLTALVPAMRRRLSVERRLGSAPRVMAALAVALAQLGAPAFVIGIRGEVHETNAAGRQLLGQAWATTMAALRDAVARPAARPGLELIDLHEHGMPRHYLAIVRAQDGDGHLAARVHAAARRWHLTPRQVQVLELVARGQANATIAILLGVGTSAIEFHVRAIFDRVGVDSRAALIAHLFTA